MCALMGPILVMLVFLMPQVALSQSRDSVDLKGLPDLTRLRFASTPTVSIGDGRAPEYELARVGGVIRLSDQRIAVLNGGTSELRIYSPEGDFVCTAGGRGEGPGEIMSADRLFRGLGDSLVVWDGRAARVSVFTSGCRFARTVPLTPRPGVARLEGVDGQGRLLVVAAELRASAQGEITRILESRMLYDPHGALLDTIGMSPGVSGVIRGTSDRVEVLRPLVAPTTTYAVSGSIMWVATGETRRLERVDLTAGSRRVITWGGPDLTMTPAYRKAIIEDLVRKVPEDRRSGYRASLESRPVPESIPATTRVLADGVGRAWLELASTPGQVGQVTWIVFGHNGTPEARLDLPRNMSIQSVGADAILVVETDALDVEHVQLYRIEGA